MADLLPSTPDLSGTEQTEPRVVGVDSDDADEMLSALSSNTARDALAELHEEPDTASGLADRLDTSLQNAQYHLGNLDEAGLVDVADTVYSEKGREMKVYAPADKPLVVYAGQEQDTLGVKEALSRMLGAVALLAVASLVVQAWLADLPNPLGGTGSAADEGVAMETADGGTADQAVAAAGGLDPGLLFFIGGLVALLLAGSYWYYRRR